MTNFTTHTPGTASDKGREVLDAAKAKFDFVPNLLKKPVPKHLY